MKTFCVNHVPFGVTEGLAALIDAKGLSSAAKKFQCGCLTGPITYLKRAGIKMAFR